MSHNLIFLQLYYNASQTYVNQAFLHARNITNSTNATYDYSLNAPPLPNKDGLLTPQSATIRIFANNPLPQLIQIFTQTMQPYQLPLPLTHINHNNFFNNINTANNST